MVQGDVTNLPRSIVRNPEWHFAADMDHATAVATRRKVYDQLVADRMIVQGYHYTFPAAAYIEKDGNGYRHNPIVLAAGAVTRHRLNARKGRRKAAFVVYCMVRRTRQER